MTKTQRKKEAQRFNISMEEGESFAHFSQRMGLYVLCASLVIHMMDGWSQGHDSLMMLRTD
jgi:hypothetical protein